MRNHHPHQMNQIQKLQQIEYTDHYSVFDKNGKKICDTATIHDAMLMVSFEEGRTYKQIKILLDQVVNIPSTRMEDDNQLKAQNVLPESMAEPVIV
jgi:hypothetical protein